MVNRARFAACSALLVCVSCYEEAEWSVVDSPLGRLEIVTSSRDVEIFVRPSEDRNDEVFIGPDLFDGFWPSITHRQAIEHFGEPLFVRRRGDGVSSYYRTESSLVEIAHEMTGSSGETWQWVLRAYPDDRDANAMLTQELANYIASSDGHIGLSINNHNYTSKKYVNAVGGEVCYVIWISHGN